MNSLHRISVRTICQTPFAIMLLGTIIQLAGAQMPLSRPPKIEAIASPSYPDGNEIRVSYTITNETDDELKMAITSGEFGTKITLENPQGKRVTPYPYYPLVSTAMFKIALIKPGEAKAAQIDLSNWFPFYDAGVYRCVLTKRVYSSENDPVPNAPDSLRGRPIDVTTEPFQFRVESPSTTKLRSLVEPITGLMPGDHLDGISTVQWYDPPVHNASNEAAARTSDTPKTITIPRGTGIKAPSTAPTSPLSEEPTSSTPWSIIVVLIVVAIGLLWLLIKKRK